MSKIRLNKYLADMGIDARRKIDKMIENGEITINGKTAGLGEQVEPGTDLIKIKGKEIKNKIEKKVYYLFNKPKFVLSAVKDSSKKKLVTDYFKTEARIFPIGRLDYETEGLIIMTNDGELFNQIIHPRSEIFKNYIAVISGEIDEAKMEKLRNGIMLDDGVTLPAEVKIIKKGANPVVEISIREGRNRQIRRMFKAVKCNVIELKRVSIGKIELGDLKSGAYRELTKTEVKYLYSL